MRKLAIILSVLMSSLMLEAQQEPAYMAKGPCHKCDKKGEHYHTFFFNGQKTIIYYYND